MSSGYIYVMTNPTMPGLAKVGKTSRDPSTRVAELSGATGVASPFILIFQQPVDDCDLAEKWVHLELERRGFRHASNREFFNGPLHEIISVVSSGVHVTSTSPALETEGDLDNRSDSRELANELVEMALDATLGTEDVFENPKKALELLEQAAALNHVLACRNAGMAYQLGLHVKLNNERALDFYKKAVRLGGWEVEACIADLFFQTGKISAAQKHWQIFFENACAEFAGVPLDVAESKNHMAYPSRLSSRVYIICDAAAKYCVYVATNRFDECVSRDILCKIKPYVEVAIRRKLITFTESYNTHMFIKNAQEWQAALDYLESATM